MIVITRNGTTKVYTGWRAWLLASIASVAVFFSLLLICLLLLGFALSVGLLMMLLIPAALVMLGLSALLVRKTGG